MNGGTLSGGVVIALAATLWLAYLLPTWLRRRDYLNAERNAVRLQQTLRILAETAEVPHEVRVEATAREVARQQKLLKKVRAKADAAARAHAVSEARAAARIAAAAAQDAGLGASLVGAVDLSASDAVPAGPAGPSSSADSSGGAGATRRAAPSRAVNASSREDRERTFAHAVRRTRLATTGVVIAGLVGVGFGGYSLVTVGSWWLLAASAALLGCAVVVLRRLSQQVAAHQAARRVRVNVVRQNPDLYDHALHGEAETVQEEQEDRDSSWEPQPLPKPMYQSPGSRAATAMASLDAAVALRRAAARAEFEERAARLAAAQVRTLPVPKETQATQPAAGSAENPGQERASSRYARMGVLDEVPSEHIDLDEALRRRRAAV
ncbi:hypothetical protein ACO2Q7_05810 [Rathayibacter sp. KR2-224]|uniref:hypothetical protein n=1 Tax=Rathayibacter sp. KR2-224 TaxID=3400913 RepID=UPI003BFF0717